MISSRPHALTREEIVIRRVHRWQIASAEWNAFAAAAGASFRGTLDWNLLTTLPLRTHFLEFREVSTGKKLGQCIVAGRGRSYEFVDGMALLPTYSSAWPLFFQLVLREIGAGDYVYGNFWSAEVPRHTEALSTPGVAMRGVRPYRLQVVQASDWPDWPSYFAKLHTNVRRNVAKAEKQHATYDITHARGLACMRYVRDLTEIRKSVFGQKGIPFNAVGSFLRALGRVVLLREHVQISVIESTGRPAAAFSGLWFANRLYYIDGGSLRDNAGLGWVLLTNVISLCFKTPTPSCFVFGWKEDEDESAPALIWSRQQCRATEIPGSVFSFSYDPSRAWTSPAST